MFALMKLSACALDKKMTATATLQYLALTPWALGPLIKTVIYGWCLAAQGAKADPGILKRHA
jgi:hypothetical protein